MSTFDYQKTLERNKAVYHDPLWNIFCYIRNLALMAGGVFVIAMVITEDGNTPVTRLTVFFITLAIAFLLHRTYKRLTGTKLERLDTSLSRDENHKFIMYFLDADEEYGFSSSGPGFIIMQRQGFGMGLFTPHLLVILLFDGYILFNGQNIDRYGRLFPPFTGSAVIRRELINALGRFKTN